MDLFAGQEFCCMILKVFVCPEKIADFCEVVEDDDNVGDSKRCEAFFNS